MWSPGSGAFEQLTHSSRDHSNPSCSVDGRQIVFSSGDIRLRFDRISGVEAPIDDASSISPSEPQTDAAFDVGRCDAGTTSRSHDGSRLACAVHSEDIAVVDVATQREMVRVTFDQKSAGGYHYAPWSLQPTWSPDDARLLVGTLDVARRL